jgi:ribosomal protein S12 methylthiotransferase accessory factor
VRRVAYASSWSAADGRDRIPEAGAMRVEAWLPGGFEVDASVRGFTVRTDQPLDAGGADSAPSPLELFLASLATCGAYYALRFCRRRGIATEGMTLVAEATKDDAGARIETVRLELGLPAGFPGKYREALVRAVDQCAVRRALDAPPRFETALRDPEPKVA